MTDNANPILFWVAKDPDGVADYSWAPTLDPSDTIASHTISRQSGDAVIDSDAHTDAKLVAWLSAGSAGVRSVFALEVVTAGGRTFPATAYLDLIETDNALVTAFLRRFPAFSAVPAETILYWITDAETIVTDSWATADIEPAKLTLAAHNLALSGAGSTGGAVSSLAAMGVTDFKSASMSVSFDAETVRRSGNGGYSSTRYGVQFLTYLRRNVGGPRLVGCGA